MLAQGNATDSAEAVVIKQYNDALSQKASDFKKAKGDVVVHIVDTQAPFNLVLDNPGNFGTNATCYASDGKSCAWWNDYHPAYIIQEQVAVEFASVVGYPFQAKPNRTLATKP
jgi:hypothetical protein